MTDLLERCMGLDIHRDVIVACLLEGSIGAKPETEIRSFSTLTEGLSRLREWALQNDCRHIAMESTGIYWIPAYETLETCFDGDIEILVVNARHMKNVPGRKTDIRDSEWIATLLRAGLLKGSFVPDKPFRELRHLTRYRKNIITDVTSQKNRIDKFLHSAGFRLSMFLSDTFSASGRNIIKHLFTHGQITLEALDGCLKTKTRHKINDVMTAVNGTLSPHQRECLKMMYEYLEQIEAHKKLIEASIAQEIQKHSAALALLCSIPGIDVTAASSIIAEIGTDMNKFPTAEHMSSWAGLSPGNNESAGKRKSARINKGNPYVKSMLCEVAWVISSKRNTYLSGWYWRIKQKKGAKRATIALAHKLFVMIYAMLKSGSMYDENVFEERRKSCQRKRESNLIRELAKLGYRVEPPKV